MSLKKNINLAGVFSIATGAMISSGIFVLPGLAFSKAGPAVFISYILGGLLALMGIFSVIELSTAMPKAGGDYYFINRTFGSLFGTISGFLGWFALALKSAFAIFGISEIIYVLFGISPILSAGILCLLFLVINVAGVKEATTFQIIMVAGLLLLLLLYIIIGIPRIEPSHFDDFLGKGVNSIIITSGFIFISFGGLLKVANISEEVINPKRNIPLGMILSIGIVTLFYGLIVIVLTGVLPPGEFAGSLTPVADSARILMGNIGYGVIIAASMLAFITTANAGLMSSSRYPLALSRDHLLPPFFSRVSRKKESPVIALSITSVMIFLALLLPLDVLVKAASTVILTSYVLTNLAIIILRESNLSNYRPSFKAPLYPWLQIASIILFGYFIIDLGAQAIEISLLFIFACLCLYLFYGRKRGTGDFALLHLLKRITDTRLTEDLLETELRDIIITRDEIQQDRFDCLVRDAKVYDIQGKSDFSSLLRTVAPDIAKEIGMEEGEVIRRYTERHESMNTAISDFLAIPHIITDGDEDAFMHVVRCSEGVDFHPDNPSVKAVFFLGGSKDARVLHLKTIAAIASLVGEEDFPEKWMAAGSATELKDAMLLSRRQRYL